MARKRGMGLSYQGCLNLNEWRHLFNPNSESAQLGRLRCFDHWNKTTNGERSISGQTDENVSQSGNEPVVFDEGGTRRSIYPMDAPRSLEAYAPGYGPNGNQNQQPDSNGRKLIVLILVLVILGYGFKNL